MRGAIAFAAILVLAAMLSFVPGINAENNSSWTDKYEPDNTFSEAKEIKSGEVQQRSLPKGDVDIAYFVLDTWSFVTIETAPGPGQEDGDTVMYLYNEEKKEIAWDDNSGTGLYSKISIFLPKGKYYVKIVGKTPIEEYFLYFVAKPESPPLVFSATDPRGDDNGPGTYVYPMSSNFTKGAFDITSFKVYETKLFVGFSISFATLGGNPWNLTYGYSLQIIGIYVDAVDGQGATYIGPGPNVQVPKEYGWDFGILATGAYCKLFLSNGQQVSGAITEWVSGSSVEIAFEKKMLPEEYRDVKEWKYYVLVGGYSPQEPSGWRKVDVYPGFWVFGGANASALKEGIAPRVIDYIAPPWASQQALLSSWNLTSRTPPTIYPIWENSLPPPPQEVRGNLLGQNLTISWRNYPWASGYLVEVTWGKRTVLKKEVPSSPFETELPGGVTCKVSVMTVSNGYYSSPIVLYFNVSMPPVIDLTVKPGMTSAQISWKSTTPTTVKYYEWKLQGQGKLIVGKVEKPTVSIGGLMANRTYLFSVRQVSVEGISSNWTQVSFRTLELKLKAPKVKVTPDYTGAMVSWTKVEYADQYLVKLIDQESGQLVSEKKTNKNSIYLKGLEELHGYIVYVIAINLTENVTSPSGSAKFVTKYLPSPKILGAKITKEGILVNWTSEKGEELYEIQVISEKGLKLVVDKKVPQNYTYLKLSSGKYYIKVRGYNETYKIYSPWSPAEVLTVPPPGPLQQIISILASKGYFIGGAIGGIVVILLLMKRAKRRKIEEAKRKALKRAISRKRRKGGRKGKVLDLV